jgi:serine/threonine protein kinase
VEGLQAGDPWQVGQYRLVGRLGAGGMGRVFLGRSSGGRLVAVKIIRPELAESNDFRARFGREVAAARKVSGLFTAQVVDADTEGPVPWLATAYVPGPSLADAVVAHGPLPVHTVLTLAGGLAEGLADVHAARIVHRDLKPSNVLLAHDGPRLIDFGTSRAVEASALTHTGQIVGSPGFMSPEQAEGLEVGPPSDIFSLGAVLVFAATGVGPFGTGSAAALIYRVVHGNPDLSGVPGELRPLLERCLAKYPVQRPTPEQILAWLGNTQPGADPARWLPASILQDFAEPAHADDRAPGRHAAQASPADPPVAGTPPTTTTARTYQARDMPSPSQRPTPEISWPASVVPPQGVPHGPGARGATAKQRSRRRRRVIAVSAVVALLVIATGTAIWAQWVRHPGQPVAQPTRLTAGPATDTSVAIFWSAPSGGPPPTRYLILRDGSVTGSVPGTTTSYRAIGLTPGTSYFYQVQAVRGGRRSARSSPVTVRTTTPPVSVAVLAGIDTVHYKDVTSYGLHSTPSLGTDTWSFTPKCKTGACSVHLAGDIQGHPFTATLRRSGAVYRGKAPLKGYADCVSVSYKSNLTIQVTVRKGRPAGRKWLAASWAGRLVLYSPPTVQCTASGIKADIYSNS